MMRLRKMGDRISISFRKRGDDTWHKKGDESIRYDESIVLFNHWGGKAFLNEVEEYGRQLQVWIDEKKDGVGYPLNRKEPNTVMVDFVRWLTKNMERVESSLYFGKDEGDGDNSDNGHWVYDLDDMKIVFE